MTHQEEEDEDESDDKEDWSGSEMLELELVFKCEREPSFLSGILTFLCFVCMTTGFWWLGLLAVPREPTGVLWWFGWEPWSSWTPGEDRFERWPEQDWKSGPLLESLGLHELNVRF